MLCGRLPKSLDAKLKAFFHTFFFYKRKKNLLVSFDNPSGAVLTPYDREFSYFLKSTAYFLIFPTLINRKFIFPLSLHCKRFIVNNWNNWASFISDVDSRSYIFFKSLKWWIYNINTSRKRCKTSSATLKDKVYYFSSVSSRPESLWWYGLSILFKRSLVFILLILFQFKILTNHPRSAGRVLQSANSI